MGLPSSWRLKSKADFQRLYEQGLKFVHPLAVFFVMSAENGQSKVGLTVAKRVGNAVVRNRVKRRLRAIFRSQLAEKRPLEIVVVARPGLATASFQKYEEAVARFLWWLESKKL